MHIGHDLQPSNISLSVTSEDCMTFVTCSTPTISSSSSRGWCVVQYTTSSSYRSLSAPLTIPLNSRQVRNDKAVVCLSVCTGSVCLSVLLVLCVCLVSLVCPVCLSVLLVLSIYPVSACLSLYTSDSAMLCISP